jgi:Outer membrane protein beta-barrel domain
MGKGFIRLVCVFILLSQTAQSQVIISLLFGDKLNTGKVEFGLDGGFTLSSITGNPGSYSRTGFNLGFYFDIKTKSSLMIHTGVIVKSTMGARGIQPYSLNNYTLDSIFQTGQVERELGYFNVPVEIKYMFPNRIYVEGGFMMGLMISANDLFQQKIISSNDLVYTLNIRDHLHRFDIGPIAGIGYRLMSGYGLNLGVRYYYGLTNVSNDKMYPVQYNRSLYVVIGIPVGAGKAKKKAEGS